MTGAVLSEAYGRFRASGPEWGEDHLTNHGPMVAEVLVRRGRADVVDRWVDRYSRRLEELPSATDRIVEAQWRHAWGDPRRVGDWTAFFNDQLAGQPWREVVSTWWTRLLPGVLAGTTHGVIRVGHVLRVLQAGAETPAALAELGAALAFWAAHAREVTAGPVPAGRLDPAAALASVARIPDQHGRVAERLGQLSAMAAWPHSLAALRAAPDPDAARATLTELVDAATRLYLSYGHSSPVLLVHMATAPNAVLHALPALPRELWVPSLGAAWAASAAIIAAYAPADAAPVGVVPLIDVSTDAVSEAIDRAVSHGDEHVIKFTDTAAEVYTRTGHPDALAAAAHIVNLIGG